MIFAFYSHYTLHGSYFLKKKLKISKQNFLKYASINNVCGNVGHFVCLRDRRWEKEEENDTFYTYFYDLKCNIMHINVQTFTFLKTVNIRPVILDIKFIFLYNLML